jgi:hypothetical protein
MKRIIQYIVCCCFFLGSSTLLTAQVLAKATADKDRIVIGEPVTLTLDVRAPLGQAVTWFAIDSLPHFEILKAGRVDTTDGIDGKKMQQVITVTSYDSGRWLIPILMMKVNGKAYYTDTVGIDVVYIGDASTDYRDIKDIVDVPKPWWTDYIPWALGLVTVAAIALIVYLLRSKKKVVVQKAPVPKRSPYEEAMHALQELRAAGWGQDGEVKQYYSKLNDILRVFVFRKLNMATLEKTNDELIMQLRQVPMDKETFHELAEALRMADFVKFARYKPGAPDNEKNFAIIQSAITKLNNNS